MSTSPVSTTLLALAVSAIKRFEGCDLKAYPDPASGGDPWTIGYGATGLDIHKGVVWTQAQADKDLEHRATRLIEQVTSIITAYVPEQSIAACVSLAYNIGIGGFRSSSVLRLINSGKTREAGDAFKLWNKAAGVVNKGLVKRRAEERQMFLDGLDGRASVAAKSEPATQSEPQTSAESTAPVT